MPWSSLVTPLLAQAVPAAAPAGPWYSEPWFMLLVAVAVLVVPYLIGNFLAKSMRMPDYGWKIGLILIALTAGVVIDICRWPPKLGIDLSGGVKLVYELDQEKLQEVNVDEIIKEMSKEADKAGPFTKRSPAKVVTLQAGTIEVHLPTTDADRVQKVKTALAALDLSKLSASLSLLNSRQDGDQTVLEYQAARSRTAPAVDMEKLIGAVQKRVNPGGQHEVAIRKLGADQIEVDIPDVDQTEIQIIMKMISTAGALEFHIVADERAPQDADAIEAAKRQIKNPSNDVSNGESVVGHWADLAPGFRNLQSTWLTRTVKSGLQVLMVTDDFGVTGGDLVDATLSYGMKGPQVNFQFNSAGANKFGELTGQNLPSENGLLRELGIVLDGELKSAASIQSKITFSGEITGDFTEAEVKFIVGVLNAGALPAALKKEPVSQESISAELGRDTIHASGMAMFVSSLAVLVFMLFYYRFAGIVADAAVVFNLILVLAFMIVLKSAFTLAGLAGLVLSIGMAVDSNVLIYERMREEKERGAALRMVIRNGFGRAMATIIDMHSTTIITGLVLYFIGTEQLRGFAVTLVLGLLVNLFTAVFCARVVFDVAERQRWLTQLKMLRLFGDTKIDFVGIMKPAIAISVLISVLGVAAAWHRSVVGPGMFDTDFTGGTVVQIVLQEKMSDADVRKLVEGQVKSLPDSTVVAVEGKENVQFIIRTSNQEPKEVEKALIDLFKGKLQTYGVAPLTDLHVIAAPKVAAPKGTAPKASDTKASDTKASDTKASDSKASDTKASDTKASDTKASDSKASDSKGSDTKASGTKATDTKATDTKATDTKATDTKATDTKATDTKATDTKATDTKATDTKATDTKATDTKATDTKATDTKATDTKATDTKGSDNKGDAKDIKDKSAALPSGGFRSNSITNELLMLLAGPDAMLADDPSPETPPADSKSSDKTAADKAAADKAAADKAAADKAAADKAAADKALADKAATAAEKAAADKAAANKAAAAEKAAAEKAAAEKAAAAENVAANKNATDKTSTDKALPDKALPDKAANDKAANDKVPAEKAPSSPPSSATPPTKEGEGESTGTSIFTQGGATGPEAYAGGSEVTLNMNQPIPYDSLESMLKDALAPNTRFELTNSSYQPGDRTAYKTWTLRVALPPDQATPQLEKFRDGLATTPVFLGVSNIGGRVASDTQTTALYALLASIAMIVIYIWIRFQNVIYGVGAVVALIHDVFITVAALAISSYVAPYLGFALVDPFKISLNVVAAILTICGYSISDTIVIFDRIREVRGKSPDLTPEIINLSVNQTLSRTVLTVFTVLLVTLILYTSGGQAIHAFAFTMLVGLISGTYSSVYIAAPCLLWMRRRNVQGTTRIQ